MCQKCSLARLVLDANDFFHTHIAFTMQWNANLQEAFSSWFARK